jgi:hypothetical protein
VLAFPPPLFVALDGAVSFSISATADTLGRASRAGLMTEQATVLSLQELIKDIIIVTGRVRYTHSSIAFVCVRRRLNQESSDC